MSALNKQQACSRLHAFIEQHLPLIQAMGAQIEAYDGTQFLLSAPLSQNHNDKMTAFGGSLYNLCITNAIGLCFLKCYEQGILLPDLVVAKASIEYLQPVKQTIIQAQCMSPEAPLWQSFFDQYQQEGKAGISLTSEVFNDEHCAVRFSGRFAIIGEHATGL